MGFFSWKCKRCQKSILNSCGVDRTDRNGWMAEAVAVTPNGSVIKGTYNGYGRIEAFSLSNDEGEPDLWHLSCWALAGKPTNYSGGSPFADDQGWFYKDSDYNLPDPLLLAPMAGLGAR